MLSFLFQFSHLENVGKVELPCLRVKDQESFECRVGQQWAPSPASSLALKKVLKPNAISRTPKSVCFLSLYHMSVLRLWALPEPPV